MTDSNASNFLRTIIQDDLKSGRHTNVVTRFPPEPNGYPHIGHAKSICINFGLAAEFGGVCNLRMDDTNPSTEDEEYVEALKRDVKWLGFEWGENMFYASDYFERLYGFAVELIEAGKAYVCSLNEEEIRDYRGTVKEAGRPSPFRERTVAENIELFSKMRAGDFPDGAHVLRAKIDMSASNMKMRDPLLYRIRHAHHYRTGDDWPIYPMYDFAHCLEDAIEKITHSICTLEFENNRDVYDWVVDNVELGHKRPHQFEFARLNLNYTVMSKRKLLQLVQDGLVSGWDDPRMPTISGLRRRGYTPASIRNFANMIGVAKTNSMVDVSLLEYSIRDDLNHKAPRVMGVLDPLKLVITNYPENMVESLSASLWPNDVPNDADRLVPFTREIYIERSDFMETPEKGFNRLAPGREVRLRYAYFIRAERVVRSADGEVICLECTYDKATKGGNAPDGRKVKGTIHWVSASEGVQVPVNLYDRLFCVENPSATDDFKAVINPDSLKTITAIVEPYAMTAKPGDHLQFERNGYFFVDPIDSTEGSPVFNRVVTLKSGWENKGRKSEQSADIKPNPKPKQGVVGRSRTEQLQYLFDQDSTLKVRYDELCSIGGVQESAAGVIAVDAGLYSLFQEAVSVSQAAGAVAKWVANEVAGALKGRELSDVELTGASLGALVKLIEDGSISGKIAKGLFEELVESGGDPVQMVESRGLMQISDESILGAIIDDVLANNSDNVAKYRAGNTRMKGFFVGQVMQATKGKGNPGVAAKLLGKKLA